MKIIHPSTSHLQHFTRSIGKLLFAEWPVATRNFALMNLGMKIFKGPFFRCKNPRNLEEQIRGSYFVSGHQI